MYSYEAEYYYASAKSAIQILNIEVMEPKVVGTALQSVNLGDLQGANIEDTGTGGGESCAKEAPPPCELPWKVVVRREHRKGIVNIGETLLMKLLS